MKFMAIDTGFVHNKAFNVFEIGLAIVTDFNDPISKNFEIRPPEGHTYEFRIGSRIITSEDYLEKHEFPLVWRMILRNAKHCDFLCAHNVKADKPKLEQLAKHYGMPTPNVEWIDTKTISKDVLGHEWGSGNLKLEKIIKTLKMEIGPKSKSDRDAEACARIINHAVNTHGHFWLIERGIDISKERKVAPEKISTVSRGVRFVDELFDFIYDTGESYYDKVNAACQKIGVNVDISDGIDARERGEIAKNWNSLLVQVTKILELEDLRDLASFVLDEPFNIASRKFIYARISDYIKGSSEDTAERIYESLDEEKVRAAAQNGMFELLSDWAGMKRDELLDLADKSGTVLRNRRNKSDIASDVAAHYAQSEDFFEFHGAVYYIDWLFDALGYEFRAGISKSGKAGRLFLEVAAQSAQ